MNKWIWPIRIVGYVTNALVIWSFWLLRHDEMDMIRRSSSLSWAPYVHHVLVGMNVVNAIFLVLMFVACGALITSKSYAVALFTGVYVALFGYVCFLAIIRGRGVFATSLGAAYAVGNYPLYPLVLWPLPFWYGVLSILLVQLSRSKLLQE